MFVPPSGHNGDCCPRGVRTWPHYITIGLVSHSACNHNLLGKQKHFNGYPMRAAQGDIGNKMLRDVPTLTGFVAKHK